MFLEFPHNRVLRTNASITSTILITRIADPSLSEMKKEYRKHTGTNIRRISVRENCQKWPIRERVGRLGGVEGVRAGEGLGLYVRLCYKKTA
jgi:hypothetical protein